jgi:predicted site-specific integrase-resolvase
MDTHEQLLRPKDVLQYLNISPSTLCRWTKENKLKFVTTKGGKHRYYQKEIFAFRNNQEIKKSNSNKIQPDHSTSSTSSSTFTPLDHRKRICYCRVSSSSQKDDLNRQVLFFRSQYPNHTIITDIGSGLNFKRRGLQTILDFAIQGDLLEIVVTHKDRLCRFGFEFIERIISKTTNGDGKIVVLDQRTSSAHDELISDLISIITVFSSRMYGVRSHSIKNKIKQTIHEEEDLHRQHQLELQNRNRKKIEIETGKEEKYETDKDLQRSNSSNENTEGGVITDDGTISVVL